MSESPTPEQERNREVVMKILLLAERLNTNLEHVIPLLERALPVIAVMNHKLGGVVKQARAGNMTRSEFAQMGHDLSEFAKGLGDFLGNFR